MPKNKPVSISVFSPDGEKKYITSKMASSWNGKILQQINHCGFATVDFSNTNGLKLWPYFSSIFENVDVALLEFRNGDSLVQTLLSEYPGYRGMYFDRNYKYAVKLSTEESFQVLQHARWATRRVWNRGIDFFKGVLQMRGKLPNQGELYTAVVKGQSDFKDVSSAILNATCGDLEKAFKAFDKKRSCDDDHTIAACNARCKGFPKYRSCKEIAWGVGANPSGGLYSHDEAFYWGEKKQRGLQGVNVKKHRSLPSAPKAVHLKHDSTGKYFITYVVRRPAQKNVPCGQGVVGLDWGMKTYLTLSNGRVIDFPMEIVESSWRKLGSLQRARSAKVKGSNSYAKASKAVNREHAWLTRTIDDWQWKIVNQLVDEYGVIAIEDLNLARMGQRTGRKAFNRKLRRLAPGKFIEKLKSVAMERGAIIVEADRFFASSKLCSGCGFRRDELPLSERTWECPSCNQKHDRDLNAALNLEQYARTALQALQQNIDN